MPTPATNSYTIARIYDWTHAHPVTSIAMVALLAINVAFVVLALYHCRCRACDAHWALWRRGRADLCQQCTHDHDAHPARHETPSPRSTR